MGALLGGSFSRGSLAFSPFEESLEDSLEDPLKLLPPRAARGLIDPRAALPLLVLPSSSSLLPPRLVLPGAELVLRARNAEPGREALSPPLPSPPLAPCLD